MTPMVEFISTDKRWPVEAVSFRGDVEVGFASSGKESVKPKVLTIVTPRSTVTEEVARKVYELTPDQVLVKIYPDSKGKVIDLETNKELPEGFESAEPVSTLNQLNIRTANK